MVNSSMPRRYWDTGAGQSSAWYRLSNITHWLTMFDYLGTNNYLTRNVIQYRARDKILPDAINQTTHGKPQLIHVHPVTMLHAWNWKNHIIIREKQTTYSNNANKLKIQLTISLCYRHILIKPLDFYKQKHTLVDSHSHTFAKVMCAIIPSKK